jgi:hypothetical protein
MSKIRCLLSPALLVLAGLGAARADEKVLVPGNPPLTQGMVDDYCRFVEWRWPRALDRLGGPQRLGQVIANDWKNGDKARQEAFLADLKWWREDFPKLDRAQRERLVARDQAHSPYADPLRQTSEEQARLWAQQQRAIHLAQLQQWNDARQLDILGLSNLQAKHHETMMMLIRNIRPSGRYEYNPSTGRYDRYVPN